MRRALCGRRPSLANRGWRWPSRPPSLPISSAPPTGAPTASLCSGAPPEARDRGYPTCARRRRGDLSVEQSRVELSRGPQHRLWSGLPLWPIELVGNALGWSDTPSNAKRRCPTPVPEETCTECPAGPARRLYKGRDWSLGIHWRGTPWQTGRALGVL